MTQASKIIDVTRSFIPVDPNAYPETMHSTDQEDSPEKRFPVVPYIGHNFMPTSYGYKSYFGLNAKINISSLSPNKAEAIFIFQTLTYKNILIALCDTGIWVKSSTAVGAWVQLNVLIGPAPAVYYEWTYCIIKNKLYCFRGNGAAYYLIETDIVAPTGIVATAVIPNFITIAEQLGMFRLGARLAFWDANNAIAIANPDDLADFTPAVLTGANVTTFNSITGKIAAIRSHGANAIVYASRSIIWLQVNPGETFFVKAIPLISNSGTVYAKQSCEASPDTLHFAYTDTGIYKIENLKPEIIVPEVFDYLKGLTTQPIYLKVLAGRHLFFNLIDLSTVNGKAQFQKKVIPASSITFPGTNTSLDAISAMTPAAFGDICEVANKLTDGYFDEQKADADAAVPPAIRKPGTGVEPVYICYLADQSGPALPIQWNIAPCGSVQSPVNFEPAPTGNGGKTSQLTTDATNKTAKSGANVYLDGKWTMQRFVQYQTALWEASEKNISRFVSEVEARAQFNAPVITLNTNVCAAGLVEGADCLLGRYATKFSSPQFGFNKCSFWLTRWATDFKDLKSITTTNTACVNTATPLGPMYRAAINGSGTGALFGTVAEVVAWFQGISAPGSVAGHTPLANGAVIGPGPQDTTTLIANFGALTSNGAATAYSVLIVYTAVGAGKVGHTVTNGSYPNLPVVVNQYLTGYYDKSVTVGYSNRGVEAVQVPIPETGYCELSGWNYVNMQGVSTFVPAGSCGVVDKYPSAALSATRAVPKDDARGSQLNPVDGSFCSMPLELPNVPTLLPAEIVAWTDQTVTFPAISFLTQDGSIAPKDLTFNGALVYDLHLKKWGKMKAPYKQLLDYSPINAATQAIIAFDNFGILAGALKADGFIYVFDNAPSDSQLTWGKIGYYRLGMTDMQTIRIDFASQSSGTIEVQASLDGTSLAQELVTTKVFNGSSALIHPDYSGKWHNITLRGKYDVSYMEPIGLPKGRR